LSSQYLPLFHKYMHNYLCLVSKFRTSTTLLTAGPYLSVRSTYTSLQSTRFSSHVPGKLQTIFDLVCGRSLIVWSVSYQWRTTFWAEGRVRSRNTCGPHCDKQLHTCCTYVSLMAIWCNTAAGKS